MESLSTFLEKYLKVYKSSCDNLSIWFTVQKFDSLTKVTATFKMRPYIKRGRGGVLEPIPAVIGRKAGYTLDRPVSLFSAVKEKAHCTVPEERAVLDEDDYSLT
ncbi:hypothetical protein AOLI_G00112590 [Acnodon oligacanthus]